MLKPRIQRPRAADEKQDKDFPLLTLKSRLRLKGKLSASNRGPMLVTKKHVTWIIESDHDIAPFIGCEVVVEGLKTSMDRISADFVGRA